MKENFIKNYDKILEFVEKRENLKSNTEIVRIYRMQTVINYSSLKTKLIKIKENIDSETVSKEKNDI